MSKEPARYQDWSVIYEATTDYEGDLVRDRLDDNGIAAVLLTQRDHSFNLNVGDLAPVRVMVRPEDIERAQAVLDELPLTDEELEQAAMAADPQAPDAHNASSEAMLDSGLDTLRFSAPDENDDEEETP